MPAWEVSQASQATLEVVPAPVQADLRALQVAQDFLTSVLPLEVQLKETPMLLPKRRLLPKLLVQSAPALEVRVTPPPDLVEKSLASLVMASRPVLVRLLDLAPALELELALELAPREMQVSALLPMQGWVARPELALQAMLDLELALAPLEMLM